MFVWLIWTGVVAVLILKASAYMLEIKKEWWMKLILFFGCWLIEGMIIFIGDLDNLPPTIIIFLLTVFISCKGSFLKKITIGLMLASTIFAYNALIDNFMSIGSRGIRLVFAFILFILTRYFAPEKDYELTKKMWRLLLLLTMTPIGIVLSVILLSDVNSMRFPNSKMYFILLVIAYLSFIGLLWTVTVLVKQRKLERQNMFAEINRKYYEVMEQQHFEMRCLKHDLANHLQVLAALPEERKQEYIKGLLENKTVTRTLNYCADSTVNAVLTVKENFIKQNKIKFERKIDISKELPFEKTDICALLANALDNSIDDMIIVRLK